MLFLTTNQQCQRTEGKKKLLTTTIKRNSKEEMWHYREIFNDVILRCLLPQQLQKSIAQTATCECKNLCKNTLQQGGHKVGEKN